MGEGFFDGQQIVGREGKVSFFSLCVFAGKVQSGTLQEYTLRRKEFDMRQLFSVNREFPCSPAWKEGRQR